MEEENEKEHPSRLFTLEMLMFTIAVISGMVLLYSLVTREINIFVLFAAGLSFTLSIVMVIRLLMDPDSVRARQSDAMLKLASQTLAYMSDGLDREAAQKICGLLLPSTAAIAVAITDKEQILAYSGYEAAANPSGSMIRTLATHATLNDGMMRILFTPEEIGFSDDTTNIRAAIIVPLKIGKNVEGTLKFYYRRAKHISETQKSIAEGFGKLLSTQMAAAALEEQTKLATSMELKMLQSQINPHFLFNTLQSISNVAGIERASVTGDMVVRLANFFRYTLDHDDSVVTLAREVDLLRDYISLQELRFGERISFEMDCDARCDSCMIPKFTLQPLVENSIVHGMRSRGEGGRIRIVTQCEGDRCVIRITDNGGGFRTGSAVSESEKKGRPSIGLKNIAGRIELSGGAFRIASCIGLGTTARIILSMKGDDQT